jgi:hypothetical protein
VATKKQFELYKKLCEELGQDYDEDFENLDNAVASEQIQELIEMNKAR